LLWLVRAATQTTGGNVMRACGLLPCGPGNLAAGAGFLYLNGNLWGGATPYGEDYRTGCSLELEGRRAFGHPWIFARPLEDPARRRRFIV